MRKTSNYNLSLYDKEDKMSITAEEDSLNANMEIIDSKLKEIADKPSSDGTGGISNEAKTLLITILRAGVYTSNQKDNIDNLDELLNSVSQEVTFTKSGTTLIGNNIPTITTITQTGTTLICN